MEEGKRKVLKKTNILRQRERRNKRRGGECPKSLQGKSQRKKKKKHKKNEKPNKIYRRGTNINQNPQNAGS